MAEYFGNMILILIIWFGFGMWGIRKLLNQNPKVKNAVTDGIVSRIVRFFM